MVRIIRKFPYKTDRLVIRLINFSDIDWYLDQLMKPYISQFNDIDLSKFKRSKLRQKLRMLIMNYKVCSTTVKEVRAILEHNNERVGGISIFKSKEAGVYEIGYWILEEYQRNGFAYEALMTITNMLLTYKYITAVRLIIHETNIKSINLALKAGFEYKYSFQGKKAINLVYERRK